MEEPELRSRAERFAQERDDVNPALAYLVGTPTHDVSKRVALWTRERITCGGVFTLGISPCLLPDIEAVRGNIRAFALGSAIKYPQFRVLSQLDGIASVVILVKHRREGKDGGYELIDGAHRLVALCRAGIPEVDAYVAHMSA